MSTQATTLNSKKSVGALVKDWMSLVGIAILIVVFSIISYVKFGAQYFLTWSNWKNILLQSSTVAIVALGQSIMLLTGNFDLSLGRMVCLTSCVGAILMKNVGMSTGLAILIMFAIGLAVGAVNGFMVSYVGVPAMIATLGTQYICYGLAKLLTQAVPIANMPDSMTYEGVVCPVAKSLRARTVNLFLHPTWEKEHIQRVIDAFTTVHNAHLKK